MTNRIPTILKERRRELGLTQIEVAMESGIELQQYQRFEKGIRPFETCSFKIGLRVCAALELDPYSYSSAIDKNTVPILTDRPYKMGIFL